jgi:geranyl-CoA carboxylase alpha subunit
MSRFSKLLVANRGEIACRVLRSARELGYRTVAVASDADLDAPHVALADEAVRIGPGPVAQSYLSIDAILDAAAKTGADALHPGYGFLAENAELARRCADAGVVFVGPPPAAIALMGDKVQAKRRMIDAGVPTAPSYLGHDQADQSDARLLAEAKALGLPLLVKAVAGGGGRGMRKVTDLAALPEAVASARSEARSAFGNGDLFLEKLITGARHVEIQVFADTHGHVIHLGERECSAQRRHQKVIEEAPSPVVEDALRRWMGEAAVAAARAIEYVGAGTVEFLLDDEGAFYFLEMNTRLQVEHPVTELVTGLDLVEWQLAVAQGESLPLPQEGLRMRGHAIEVRLYAEDPAANFLPQVGTVARWLPAEGPGIRVDAGIVTGSRVSAFYDPMLAKIIAHGRSRDDARRRLVGALRRTECLGLQTNRAFLIDLLESELFVAGNVKTDTLDAQTYEAVAPSDLHWAVAAALVARVDGDRWRSSGYGVWPVTLEHRETSRVLEVEALPSGRVRVGEIELDMRGEGPASARVLHDGIATIASFVRDGSSLHLQLRGDAFTFREPQIVTDDALSAHGGSIVAPITGRVVAVSVAPGAEVTAGQTLVVLEAMKMEHRVEAPRVGRVATVSVAIDDQVDGGQVLCVLEEEQT